jgi:hypothetical protein
MIKQEPLSRTSGQNKISTLHRNITIGTTIISVPNPHPNWQNKIRRGGGGDNGPDTIAIEVLYTVKGEAISQAAATTSHGWNLSSFISFLEDANGGGAEGRGEI